MERNTRTGSGGLGAPKPRSGEGGPDAPKPHSGEGGFTLVELLIVISLISILAAMGLVQYRNSVISAKESTLKTDLFRMRDAIDQYYADKGKYPGALDSLVSDGYMRKIPEDPFTKTTDSWTTVPAEPDPTNPSAEPGVYDVKSGAPGTALDGTSYTDW
jgi:general secretion pathway protein G